MGFVPKTIPCPEFFSSDATCSTKSLGQTLLPFLYPCQGGLPEVANKAVSYSFCNRSSDSGASFTVTLLDVPTKAMSNLLNSLYFPENPCTRLGTCQMMVPRYFQCFSSSFQKSRRFFGCSKAMIEKSGFCTLATFVIHFSVKSSGMLSVSR